MASETSRAHLRRKAQGKETVEGNGSSAAGAGSQGKGKRKAEVSVEEYAAKPESKAASAAKAATAKGATKDGRGQKRAKKGKDISSPSAPSGSDTIADESLPKNKTVPAELKYEPRAEGQTRFVTWNVTSMKSSEPKGMFRYIEAESPDVLILTETKVNEVPDNARLNAIYKHQYWGIGTQKGYAGVAVLTKLKPQEVSYGLPGIDTDTKGRLLTLEFENSILIATYVVNAGEGLKTMEEKKRWNAAFEEHMRACDERKPVIWAGDLNVVLDERDLAQASKKWNKSPGYTTIECNAHHKLLNPSFIPSDPDSDADSQPDGTNANADADAESFIDIWRALHPDAVGHYTYYGWRGNCREKGIGWRLDSFVVSKRIRERVRACEIRHEVYGASDHVPVYCDIEGVL